MKIPTLMLAATAFGLSGCATYAPPPGPPPVYGAMVIESAFVAV